MDSNGLGRHCSFLFFVGIYCEEAPTDSLGVYAFFANLKEYSAMAVDETMVAGLCFADIKGRRLSRLNAR